MENKNYKYIKRNTLVISLVDLRMEYIRATGIEVPLNHNHCGDVHYIVWLEEEILRLKKLTQKLIPFET
jgi:hypothetical protein